MSTTCKVVKMGFADTKEAERKLNEILKDIDNFINYKIVNNGHHSLILIFSGDTNNSITPQVKIIEYSVNDNNRAEELINKAIKDILPISIDICTSTDGNRLIVLYDAND